MPIANRRNVWVLRIIQDAYRLAYLIVCMSGVIRGAFDAAGRMFYIISHATHGVFNPRFKARAIFAERASTTSSIKLTIDSGHLTYDGDACLG